MANMFKRPQYKTVEVPKAENPAPQTPPEPVQPQEPVPQPSVAQTPAQTPTQTQAPVQPQQTSPPPNQPKPPKHHESHPLRNLMFLIPALLVIGTIVVATYFIRNDFVVREPEPVPSVKPVETTPTPAPVEKETVSELGNYTSDEISFQYPQSLQLLDCPQGTYLIEKSDQEIILDDFCATRSDFIISILRNQFPADIEELEVLSSEKSITAGLETTIYEIRSGEGSDLFVEVPFRDNYYRVTLADPNFSNEFKTILGTFELLVDPLADWVIFEDDSLDLSFYYPPEWTVTPIVIDQKEEIITRIIVSKNESERSGPQTLVMDVSSDLANAQLTASEIISATRSLAGWDERPTNELRSIGGASASLIKGYFDEIWNVYVVIWYRDNVIEMIWEDDLEREYDETFELILSSFEF